MEFVIFRIWYIGRQRIELINNIISEESGWWWKKSFRKNNKREKKDIGTLRKFEFIIKQI